ncbi:choice-of-anchor A family protein [Massilia endophytica]|uniref:choice-of-anchor A family protein n=1 Tax=Massilia endophytica TaxID=2899220 RepID=UPI001E2AA7B2|nr:choice-of-anchor A family protein [Massilia endophytica]UGQ47267.1 choice-of-anchor A family protein [Massilia endophytica]
MSKLITGTMLAGALLAGAAKADTLDLGFIKGANLFSLGSFTAMGSDVEGAVIVRGDANVANYSINAKNEDAYGSYSLVVGGNLNYNSGSISNGQWYVGGTSLLTSFGADSASFAAGAPTGLNLGAMASQALGVSSALAQAPSTGSVNTQWGGLFVSGTGKSVEVFDLTGAMLQSVNWLNVSNLAANATLIFNVSGADALGFNQNGGGFGAFSNYNVLFNFYESTHLNFASIGLEASVLAPLATVTGGGVITGNVIAGNWAAQTQVNAGNAFQAANVQGFAPSVAEPAPWAMGLIGFCLIGFLGRRSRRGAEIRVEPPPQEPSGQ